MQLRDCSWDCNSPRVSQNQCNSFASPIDSLQTLCFRVILSLGKKNITRVMENKSKSAGKSATRIMRLQGAPLASTDLIFEIKKISKDGKQCAREETRENAGSYVITKLLFLESACRFNPATKPRVRAATRLCPSLVAEISERVFFSRRYREKSDALFISLSLCFS